MPYYIYGIADRYVVPIMPGPNMSGPNSNRLFIRKFAWNEEPITDEDRAQMYSELAIKSVPRALRNRPIDVMLMGVYDWFVSDRMKNKIEELDPGKNEFFPVDVTFEKHAQEIEPFWYMASRNQLDAIDMDRTFFKKEKTGIEVGKTANFKPWRRWGPEYPCTLKQSEMGKAHFWRGFEERSGLFVFFCSDEFYQWMKDNDIVGFEFYKCEVWPPLH